MKAAVISGSSEPNKLATIKDITLPPIKPHQLLIKAKAFAINPTDWKHILYGIGQVDNIIGTDVSGIVEEVGSDVNGFAVGDCVSSFIHGNTSHTEGAFGEYAIVNPLATIKYPKGLHSAEGQAKPAETITSFEGAASVTLGLVTVAISFSYYLNIDYNQDNNKDDFILIWGGSGASGVLAIQVAKVIYGLNVIATASSKNFKYLKSLGADYVIDYKDPGIVEKIKQIGNGRIKYALDTIAEKETFQQVYDATEGTPEVYLDNLLGLDGNSIETRPERNVHYGCTLAYNSLEKEVQIGPVKYIQTPELLNKYTEFWQGVLPLYIDQIYHSNLLILPRGLESVNRGLELSRQGKVSAEKVVFGI
ncbi:uncharacterized protein J8A68_003017 [[Candida] subhashii]|uniref:Enoyl reductase (ER) domain-containing protein n=1 Tax=[Candida] subhashii TaxID=561895 RepID=A0A8J5UX44_9ASCO|nr:uncharacterized protein J8A68_003017 [[Candida] subhashii]KAG7663470.1 hypothetical protein J8A68_003017 [[Candida] subhashii]